MNNTVFSIDGVSVSFLGCELFVGWRVVSTCHYLITGYANCNISLCINIIIIEENGGIIRATTTLSRRARTVNGRKG